MTLEADGSGAIYPVLYLRRAGRVEERAIEPDAAPPVRHAGDAGAGRRDPGRGAAIQLAATRLIWHELVVDG